MESIEGKLEDSRRDNVSQMTAFRVLDSLQIKVTELQENKDMHGSQKTDVMWNMVQNINSIKNDQAEMKKNFSSLSESLRSLTTSIPAMESRLAQSSQNLATAANSSGQGGQQTGRRVSMRGAAMLVGAARRMSRTGTGSP